MRLFYNCVIKSYKKYSTLVFFFSFYLSFFFFGRAACGILDPRPGFEPTPLALEAWHLNHWTAREVPQPYFLKAIQNDRFTSQIHDSYAF